VLLGLIVGGVIYFNAGRLGDLVIGPIPKGTPVNLLANFNSEADPALQKQAFKALLGGLAEIKSRNLDADQTRRVLREKVAPELMKVNKCPDFVMDKGQFDVGRRQERVDRAPENPVTMGHERRVAARGIGI
jgi:hypothetical protein